MNSSALDQNLSNDIKLDDSLAGDNIEHDNNGDTIFKQFSLLGYQKQSN